ncbi:MAG: hypothetical protein JWN04_1452 [Myxococcaceae bacterium]|nr:hypothetical protein [Myxococcaceae bacterium]
MMAVLNWILSVVMWGALAVFCAAMACAIAWQVLSASARALVSLYVRALRWFSPRATLAGWNVQAGRAWAALEGGDLSLAERCAARALAIAKRMVESRDLFLATSLLLRMRVLVAQERRPTAFARWALAKREVTCYQRELLLPDMRESLTELVALYAPSEHDRESQCSLAMAELLEALAARAAAYDTKPCRGAGAGAFRAMCMEFSLEVRSAVLGVHFAGAAEMLRDLVRTLRYKERDSGRVLAYAQRAIQAREQELGPDHPDLVPDLRMLAELSSRTELGWKARQRSLVILERAGRLNEIKDREVLESRLLPQEEARLYNAIVDALRVQYDDRVGLANDLMERANVLTPSVWDRDRPASATLRQRARELYREALVQDEETFGAAHLSDGQIARAGLSDAELSRQYERVAAAVIEEQGLNLQTAQRLKARGDRAFQGSSERLYHHARQVLERAHAALDAHALQSDPNTQRAVHELVLSWAELPPPEIPPVYWHLGAQAAELAGGCRKITHVLEKRARAEAQTSRERAEYIYRNARTLWEHAYGAENIGFAELLIAEADLSEDAELYRRALNILERVPDSKYEVIKKVRQSLHWAENPEPWPIALG